MTIEWRLSEVMKEKGISNASQLELAFEQILGLAISREALGKMLRKPPIHLRLETAQYLCTLLQVSLDELLVILPEQLICQPSLLQPFGKKENPTSSLIVDPSLFF